MHYQDHFFPSRLLLIREMLCCLCVGATSTSWTVIRAQSAGRDRWTRPTQRSSPPSPHSLRYSSPASSHQSRSSSSLRRWDVVVELVMKLVGGRVFVRVELPWWCLQLWLLWWWGKTKVIDNDEDVYDNEDNNLWRHTVYRFNFAALKFCPLTPPLPR